MGLLRVECDEANNIVRTVYGGVTTADDLREASSVVKECLKSHSPCSGITDFSEVTKFDVSGGEMRALAAVSGNTRSLYESNGRTQGCHLRHVAHVPVANGTGSPKPESRPN